MTQSAAEDSAYVCARCSAVNRWQSQVCWLCGAESLGAAREASSDVGSPSARPVSGTAFTLATLMGVVTLIALSLGLADFAPGLSGLLLVVGTPALAITGIRSATAHRRGEPMSAIQKVISFILSAVVIMSVLMMLVIAAFAALFIWCVVAFRGI